MIPVKFCYANISLVGPAKIYWRSYLHNHLGQHTITLSDEMKQILINKYAPIYYQIHLLNQLFLHYKQGISILGEYLAHFEELLKKMLHL